VTRRAQVALVGLLVALTTAALVAPSASAAAGTTRLVSAGAHRLQGNDFSSGPTISTNGRFVAFVSAASNLVAVDTNGSADVFVRDRYVGTTSRVSLSSTGGQADNGSFDAAVSATGRYVVFASSATNLVPGLNNALDAVYLRDRATGSTTLVSVSSTGARAGAFTISRHPSVSSDGRYVAFYSDSPRLVPGDTNGADDVFVRDTIKGTTQRVSVSTAGVQAKGDSLEPVFSADGRSVAFYSSAPNLVPGKANGLWGVFVHDLTSGATTRVSVATDGTLGSGAQPSISHDGRYVAFAGWMPGDPPPTSGLSTIYLRDRTLGTTTRISVGRNGSPADGTSSFASVSPDGRYVGFVSDATNLVAGDTNSSGDVFVRDVRLATTTRVNVADDGSQAGFENTSGPPAVSWGDQVVAFASAADNLVPHDTNGTSDVFVRLP
jgi:Tol biopolymer transport system component